MSALLVDSGFLVALGIQSDRRHAAARAFVKGYRGKYLVPSPVVVETCYFLSGPSKVKLLDWLVAAKCEIPGIPPSAYPDIANLLDRYANLDPDFTDAAIVWLAGECNCADILTVDRRDFSTYRIRGRRKFRIVDWVDWVDWVDD